jgi:hypothetical protein
MSYPKKLLQELYWTFSFGAITDENVFISQFETYHKSILGAKKMPFKWSDVAFNFPKIEIQYLKYNEEEEDYDEPSKIINANYGKNFSYQELLFKIHQECSVLEDDDRCYFEGLMYSDSEENGIPTYFVMTGS